MKNKVIFASLCVMAVMLSACGTDLGSDKNKDIFVYEETAIVNMIGGEEDIRAFEETSAESEATTDVLPDEDDEEKIEESAETTKIKDAISSVLTSSKHIMMEEVTDKESLINYYLINPDDENLEEAVVYHYPASSTFAEIIVLKSSDTDYAKGVLKMRMDKALTKDAWYPSDENYSDEAVIGTIDDYAYFILTKNSAEDEAALIESLSEC